LQLNFLRSPRPGFECCSTRFFFSPPPTPAPLLKTSSPLVFWKDHFFLYLLVLPAGFFFCRVLLPFLLSHRRLPAPLPRLLCLFFSFYLFFLVGTPFRAGPFPRPFVFLFFFSPLFTFSFGTRAFGSQFRRPRIRCFPTTRRSRSPEIVFCWTFFRFSPPSRFLFWAPSLRFHFFRNFLSFVFLDLTLVAVFVSPGRPPLAPPFLKTSLERRRAYDFSTPAFFSRKFFFPTNLGNFVSRSPLPWWTGSPSLWLLCCFLRKIFRSFCPMDGPLWPGKPSLLLRTFLDSFQPPLCRSFPHVLLQSLWLCSAVDGPLFPLIDADESAFSHTRFSFLVNRDAAFVGSFAFRSRFPLFWSVP